MTARASARTWVALSVASAMLASAFAVGTVGSLSTSQGERARRGVLRASPFVLAAFADAWDSPERRTKLAHELARTLDAQVEVRGPGNELLTSASPSTYEQGLAPCPSFRAGTVVDAGRKRGEIRVCLEPSRPAWLAPALLLGALATICAIVTLVIARMLVMPLRALARAADRAARGEEHPVRFDAGVRAPRELAALAEAIESMRARLARHAASQEAAMATLSHELRSPLARLRVAVELLDYAASDGALRDEIRANLTSLDELVATLLDDTRLRIGADLRVAVSPHALVESVAAQFDPAPTIRMEGDLALCEAARIDADRTLVVRALSLLVENARIHGTPPVVLALSSDGTSVTIEVRDAGPAPSPTAGAGVGLAIAARIVEHHGGALALDLTARASTVARVTIPVARAGSVHA